MVILPKQLVEFLNSGSFPFQSSKFYLNGKSVYYAVTLHTKGASPRFRDLRSGRDIVPPFYFGEEYQTLFDNFLFSRHPRESLETRSWRYSQYRARTKRPFLQLIELIGALIFKEGAYTFDCTDETTKTYILSNEFDYRGFNLFEYYHRVLHTAIYEDPNGFIVHIPVVADDSTPVTIDIYHVPIYNVKTFDKDNFVFEKDNVIWWLTKNEIYKTEKGTDGQYQDPVLYYSHNFGFVPACVNGGIWNSEGFFSSFLDKAIPVADEYVSSYSAEQMIDKEASHPYITMAKMTCPACNGEKKKQVACEECINGYDLIDCQTCSGSGTISWNPADRYEASKEDMKEDLVKIINPNAEFNKYHHEKNNELMKHILASLDLLLIDSAQSGEAKALDKENLKLFASTIAERVYSRMRFSIKCIIGYRNVKRSGELLTPDFKEFVLIKPISFEIKTEDDLLQEVADAQTASLPGIIRKKALSQYVNLRYSNDPGFIKRTKLVLDFDRLATLTEEEIAQSSYDQDDILLHREIDTILEDFVLSITESVFQNLDYNETKQKFKSYLSKQTPGS